MCSHISALSWWCPEFGAAAFNPQRKGSRFDSRPCGVGVRQIEGEKERASELTIKMAYTVVAQQQQWYTSRYRASLYLAQQLAGGWFCFDHRVVPC